MPHQRTKHAPLSGNQIFFVEQKYLIVLRFVDFAQQRGAFTLRRNPRFLPLQSGLLAAQSLRRAPSGMGG
jgi:hypothetical protein